MITIMLQPVVGQQQQAQQYSKAKPHHLVGFSYFSIILLCHKSVSYTHLDVYKRQTPNTANKRYIFPGLPPDVLNASCRFLPIPLSSAKRWDETPEHLVFSYFYQTFFLPPFSNRLCCKWLHRIISSQSCPYIFLTNGTCPLRS